MSVEALWVVEPVIPPEGLPAARAAMGLPPGESAFVFRGVVVLETGRILGGDHGAVWIGEYRVLDARHFRVSVRIQFYDDDSVSLIDPTLRDYMLEGVMEVSEDHRNARGRINLPMDPRGFDVEMYKVADLPNPR